MKRAVCLFLICILTLSCAGCDRACHETVFAMDTVMDLQVWGADSEQAVQAIAGLLQDMDNLWSARKEDSKIAALNRGETVTDALLEQVQKLSQRTNGAFDPCLYNIMTLWGFDNKEYHVPAQAQIDEAMLQPKWDLGGVVKGYAGQLAAESLASFNVSHAVLNLGGNVQTYGNKPTGEPWSIGIQNPAGGDYVGLVSVVGTMSIVTSGDYQRYFEQDGVRYHHIMDPETGMPARSGLSSVTVICKDGLTADGLSTALFVMGLEKAVEFWRKSDDFEAVFITDTGKIYATQGAGLSGCEYEVIADEN